MRGEQLRSLVPFAVIGVACVIAGGFVSAAIAPSPTEHGAWAVAYLVLVAGIAQIALGAGQSLLAPRLPSTATIRAQTVGWNLGNAAVIAGTLSDVTPVVDVGGALLVVVLAMLLWATRRETVDAAGSFGAAHAWMLRGFRVLAAILLISIPIGLVLAELRG